MNFKSADAAIRDMNKRNLRAFDGLKLLKFDELNVMRSVSKVYDDSVRLAKKRYLRLAIEAYIDALILCKIARERAEEMAEDSITEDWILDMLEDYDSVTLYQFDSEVERKKQRLAESLLASLNKNEAVDRALRLWTGQVRQYADNSVVRATIDGYKAAGVKKARWETEADERVCETCNKRNGKVYDIDKVPPVPHPRCRCLLWPVID